uniref:Phlebovirus_G2 domain-containing protein n=1 Tax=Heligmosomoides polygyrus TaxID=6339 RepID=A0A183GUP3_HELPZ
LWVTLKFAIRGSQSLRRTTSARGTTGRRIAEIIAISITLNAQLCHQCQQVNLLTYYSNVCAKGSPANCQIQLSEVFKINPFKREACLRLTQNDIPIHEVRIEWHTLLLTCEPESDLFTRDTRIYLQPINNNTFEIFHCNRWAESARIKHTCSEAGGGTQVFLVGEQLGKAITARESLQRHTEWFILLQSILNLKRQQDPAIPASINIEGGNIRETVTKHLKKLEENIGDMQYELKQAESLVNTERLCMDEIKKLVKTMDQK